MSEPRAEQLTAEQRAALEAELAELEGPKRKEAVQAIKTAREFGDLSENFEYHAAKNEQGLLERRIRMLRDRLHRAVLVDESARAGATGGAARWRPPGGARLGPPPSGSARGWGSGTGRASGCRSRSRASAASRRTRR